LEELAERHKLLRKSALGVVDLGAAPGAWLQVLKKYSNAKVFPSKFFFKIQNYRKYPKY
jgi:23S rRNA U2552 (ribose-2'-O)-methylase RlmE/FtsJ